MWADQGLLAVCLMPSPGVCATHSCLPCFPSPLPHPIRSSFPLLSPVPPSCHPSSLTVFRKRRRATRPSLPLRQNVCFYWQESAFLVAPIYCGICSMRPVRPFIETGRSISGLKSLWKATAMCPLSRDEDIKSLITPTISHWRLTSEHLECLKLSLDQCF